MEEELEPQNGQPAAQIESSSNSAPTIDGTPADEAVVSNEYSFTPLANDPDGDALTFSIGNKPGWMTFDVATGQLYGTPRAEHVGTYSHITIAVSDGNAVTAIGPFSILVKDTTTGSVTLSWNAPTQNEDGSALIDLDGYRLYWGPVAGNYTDSVTIDNESITTYVVDNLPTGSYDFAATSFNTAGVESRFSSPVTKVVN